MSRNRIVFLVSTVLLSLMMLMSAFMYFIRHEEISQQFEAAGYPAYLVYPLAIAKLLGVLAINYSLSKTITYLAYAGFFFNFLLAISAHIAMGDGDYWPAILAMVLLIVSFVFRRRVEQES